MVRENLTLLNPSNIKLGKNELCIFCTTRREEPIGIVNVVYCFLATSRSFLYFRGQVSIPSGRSKVARPDPGGVRAVSGWTRQPGSGSDAVGRMLVAVGRPGVWYTPDVGFTSTGPAAVHNTLRAW